MIHFKDFYDDSEMQSLARRKLDELKFEKIPLVVPQENIMKYEISWTENGVQSFYRFVLHDILR